MFISLGSVIYCLVRFVGILFELFIYHLHVIIVLCFFFTPTLTIVSQLLYGFQFLFYLQPRLGPKPFSVGSGDVSFDKVFSVPQVPGNERVSGGDSAPVENKSTDSSDGSVDEQKDSDEKEGKKIKANRFTIKKDIHFGNVFFLLNRATFIS